MHALIIRTVIILVYCIFDRELEGEQKLSTLGQMLKQAQFKKYMSDEAVLWPKCSPDGTIILAKYQFGYSYTF